MLKDIIKEYILLLKEAETKDSDLIPHTKVVAAIKKQLGPTRTNLKEIVEEHNYRLNVDDFEKLLKEIAIVESGMATSGGITSHNNKIGENIKGVFQIGSGAIADIQEKNRNEKYVRNNIIKSEWDKNTKAAGLQQSWSEQPVDDIFSNFNMQATAAIFVCLMKHQEQGYPSLSAQQDRANFWSSAYNTDEDEKGTADYYNKRLSTFGISY